MEEKIKIYSYQKVWKIEKKIYAVMNYVLPAPINPVEAASFLIVMLLVNILSIMIPFLDYFPSIIKYILIPYGVTKFLLKKKLDGKNPFIFMIGYLWYLLIIKDTYIEGWIRHSEKKWPKKVEWCCSRGSLNNEKVSI